MTHTVLLFGCGLIGTTIKQFLTEKGFTVIAVDQAAGTDVDVVCDVKKVSHGALCELIKQHGASFVVNAMPYRLNVKIAKAVAATNTVYFDMSEDVSSAAEIKYLAAQFPEAGFITRCGLAPGAVGIIAYSLLKDFDSIKSVELRVGALPRASNNSMKYYLTWSSEGLINEYCNTCTTIRYGETEYEAPLGGYEIINIDGTDYEAFNTSGGIGSLLDTIRSSGSYIESANYKTMRYVGHHQLMKFLYDDLNMAINKETFTKLFNQAVPHICNDVVVVYVQVTGVKNKKLVAETYTKKVYGGDGISAIQRTTASGLCAMVHWASLQPELPRGFILNEVAAASLDTNPFWEVYKS